MFPPLPSTLLTDCPRFAELYKHLTTQLISNVDGSTISKNVVYEETKERLKDARERNARTVVLIQALKEIACVDVNEVREKGEQRILSESDRETVYVVAEYLERSLLGSGADQTEDLNYDFEELMTEDLTVFRERLPQIAAVLSKHLVELEKKLSQIAATANNVDGSTISSAIPTSKHTGSSYSTDISARRHLPTVHMPLSTVLRSQDEDSSTIRQDTIPNLLSDLTNTLLTLLQTNSELTTTAIRHLELSTHGTESRQVLSQSTFLSTVARGIALKTQILQRSQQIDIYNDEPTRHALHNKTEALLQENRDLDRRERDLQALLDEYAEQEGGEERFKVLGQRYGEVEEQIEIVTADIERLRAELGNAKNQPLRRW